MAPGTPRAVAYDPLPTVFDGQRVLTSGPHTCRCADTSLTPLFTNRDGGGEFGRIVVQDRMFRMLARISEFFSTTGV